MPGHLINGPQHGEIADALILERLDETSARATELRLYRGRHQSVAVSSTSRCVRSRCNGVTEM